jgi:transcriptional regulator with XRE-family HTH domain
MASLRIGRSRLPELIGDMPQVELAHRIGVSESMMSKYISGSKKMSVIRMKLAADVLNCHMEDLYEWEYHKGSR